MRHSFGPKRRPLRHAGEKTRCRKGLGVARRARKWRMVCTCQADGNSRRRPEVFENSPKTAPPCRRRAAIVGSGFRRLVNGLASLPPASTRRPCCQAARAAASRQSPQRRKARGAQGQTRRSRSHLCVLRRRALHIFLCNATIARAEHGPRQPESHAMTSAAAPQAGPGPVPGRSRPAPALRPNEPEKLAKNNDLPAEAGLIGGAIGGHWCRRASFLSLPGRDPAAPRPPPTPARPPNAPTISTHCSYGSTWLKKALGIGRRRMVLGVGSCQAAQSCLCGKADEGEGK